MDGHPHQTKEEKYMLYTVGIPAIGLVLGLAVGLGVKYYLGIDKYREKQRKLMAEDKPVKKNQGYHATKKRKKKK